MSRTKNLEHCTAAAFHGLHRADVPPDHAAGYTISAIQVCQPILRVLWALSTSLATPLGVPAKEKRH